MKVWAQSKELPNYEVSSDGDVRNKKTGRLLRIHINTHGYPAVCLHDNGKQYTRPIHRLVADAFYDGDHTGKDVNHIDGIKTNCHVSNLEWCTRSENVKHAYATGLKVDSRKKKVRVLETGKIYESIYACSNDIGVDRGQIARVVRGIEKSCKGYHVESID